jgi:acetate kinase
MNILVPNLGSTSLKYQILEMPAEAALAKGRLERVRDYREAIAQIQTGAVPIDAVAFKAVHAGPRYRGTFAIDDGVIAALEEFLPAAPAHNAIYLTGIRAFRESLPGTPLVAAFETEFHRTMPEYARQYGVPAAWRDAGVARYGFHGASHQYISERANAMLGRPLRLVSCHLGGSSSLCAIDRGRAIDTTMGFSPQSGLENATRHGDLDVFAVLFMMERKGWSAEEVRRQLASEGGLAGLSGIAGGDVRDLEASSTEAAGMALAVFSYQVKKTIGAYAAAMGGLDAVAFTGGIGENSAALRAACCEGLEFLGVRLDVGQNENGCGDRLVSSTESSVAVLALATNEELIVARRAYTLLILSRDLSLDSHGAVSAHDGH